LNVCSSAPESSVNSINSAAEASNNPSPLASASAENAMGDSIPASLAEAGEYGENVYDYAKSSDWRSVDLKLTRRKQYDYSLQI
jgi:hypothetical protein